MISMMMEEADLEVPRKVLSLEAIKRIRNSLLFNMKWTTASAVSLTLDRPS